MSTTTERPQAELDAFFDDYVRRFNEALEGSANLEEIAALYTDTFLAAGPQGVMAGQNDDAFLEVLRAGYEQYRAIGTRRMAVLGVGVTQIDEQHAMARVSFRASYVRPSDEEPIDIDFEVTYLLQKQDRWQVFAFIAGDEQALYREHGLAPKE